jgi:hypothetical protein
MECDYVVALVVFNPYSLKPGSNNTDLQSTTIYIPQKTFSHCTPKSDSLHCLVSWAYAIPS